MLIAAINFFRELIIVFNAHFKVQGLSAVSCAEMAELIKMQFGMPGWVSPVNMYNMGMQMLPWEGTLLVCLAD